MNKPTKATSDVLWRLTLRLAWPLLSIALILGAGRIADANVAVKISDTMGGVRFAWTGSINTSSLSSSGPFNNSGGIKTNGGLVFSSSTGSDGEWFQTGVSGPAIGTSPYTTYPNTLTGDFFAMHVELNSFVMPSGYVSGSNINGSVVFTGPSIMSLGITPGPHVFTLSNSPSNIIISTVPEPSGMTLVVLALFGAGACRRRYRPSFHTRLEVAETERREGAGGFGGGVLWRRG